MTVASKRKPTIPSKETAARLKAGAVLLRCLVQRDFLEPRKS